VLRVVVAADSAPAYSSHLSCWRSCPWARPNRTISDTTAAGKKNSSGMIAASRACSTALAAGPSTPIGLGTAGAITSLGCTVDSATVTSPQPASAQATGRQRRLDNLPVG
jgi:hypothetical protein